MAVRIEIMMIDLIILFITENLNILVTIVIVIKNLDMSAEVMEIEIETLIIIVETMKIVIETLIIIVKMMKIVIKLQEVKIYSKL